MGDQAVERQCAGVDERARGDQVVARPFRRDAQPGFLHEGRREREGERLGIEPGQYDLAALGHPPDQRVEQPAVAGGIVDAAIVAARICLRVHHGVASGAVTTSRIDLPDRRGRSTGRDGQPRQQPPEHAMPDDEVGKAAVDPGNRMPGRRRERNQRRLRAMRRVQLQCAVRMRDEPPRRATEQPAHRAVAIRARHENLVAGPQRRSGAGFAPPRRPPRSRGSGDSPCRETAAWCRTRTAFPFPSRCRYGRSGPRHRPLPAHPAPPIRARSLQAC